MVEDVEKSLLRFGGRHPLLYVIHNKKIYRLIELNEVVQRVLQDGTRVLHLKKARTHVEHPLLGVKLLGMEPDSVDKVSFSTAGRTVDKHRVELGGVGMFGNGKAYRTRQFVCCRPQCNY